MDISPLIVSLKTALTAAVITFFAGLLAAHLVLRLPRPYRIVWDTLFMLPLVLPPTVLGFGLLYLLGANRPLGSFLYDNFGIRLAFTWSATVIAAVVVSFPLMYRAARGALAQVDTELLDAARTMGYSEFSIFWKVWVPVARPGVITGAVLSFARGLGEFGATAMLAGNIPGQTRTLPLAIYAGVASGQEAQVVGYVTLTVAVSICLVALLSTYADREL